MMSHRVSADRSRERNRRRCHHLRDMTFPRVRVGRFHVYWKNVPVTIEDDGTQTG
jgi:hypothetical protein